MADSCSNLKRSRTELLASISKPTCSGKIGLGVEAANFLRRLVVVEHAKIVLLQIGDAASVLVGHGEHHVHFVGGRADRRQRVVASRGIWVSAGFWSCPGVAVAGACSCARRGS